MYMLRGILKRFLSLILVTGMIVTLLPFGDPDKIYAAGSIDTGFSGLSASYDNGTWSISGNVIIGSVTTTSSTSCGSTTYTPQTGTIAFTNTSSAAAIFSYTATKSDGAGTVSDSGNGQVLLQSGEEVTVSVSSSDSSEDTTKVRIVLNSFEPAGNVDVTFLPADNGSYTVDGTKITASSVISKKSSEAFVLAAAANSGYKFFGWHDVTNDRYLSLSASASVYISSSISVEPVFIPQTTAVFDANGHYYTDLNEAISYAQTNGIAKITLVSNGTLPAGNYTIPNGISLLIPFDNDQTMYKDTPTVLYNTYTTPSAFRILTMAPNANITIASGGAVSLSGNLSSKGQMGGYNGTPTGPDGRINMLEGSSITVESGGNLYVWGYIYGSGNIEAMSGATVYEAFQIKDWRGGSATSSIYDYAFIFNQYYVQNIEVPLKLNYGASEKLYSSANASGSAYPIGATYIGSGGMFRLKNGYIIKDYEESTDRNSFMIHGDMSVSPMTISGLPIIGSISTDRYVLPITSNITIDIRSGTTSLTQNVSFLPGVEMHIHEGAAFEVSSNYSTYIYDSTEWLAHKFSGTANLYVIGYSVANGTRAVRNANSLKDVLVDINGTVDAKGNLLTSESGANIISSEGTGEVLLSKAPITGSVNLYEMDSNKDKTAVPFYAAKLHNGDDSYTATSGESAGTVFYYCSIHDRWEKGNRYVLTYDSNYLDGSTSDTITQNICGEEFTLKANTFVFAGRTFKEWNTKADGSGTAYADQAKAQFSTDTTLYAQWRDHEYGGPVWNWTADNSSATATFTCIDGDDTQVIDAVITFSITPATCETAGNTVYTATVTFEGKEYTDTKEVSIPALGHDYQLSGWNWNEDNKASVVFTCKNDPAHTETVNAEVTSETTPATCEEAGKTVYTATVTYEGKEYTDSKEVSIPASGHDWSDPVWTWTDDYKASASFTCTVCGDVQIIEATVTSETSKPACETDGKTVYNAAVTFEGKEYSDSRGVSIPATGHDWDTPSYTWKEDNSSVTAERVCKNEETHTETETVNTSYAVVTEPSDDEPGTGRYTAVFTNPAFETQTKDAVIAPLGHHYGSPVWYWAEELSSAYAEFICEDCGDVQTLEAAVTSETTPATCETYGKTVYTATVSFNGNTYTDSKEVTIPATGHSYGDPVWIWTEDNKASASFTCSVCGDVQTMEASVTSETIPAKCEEAGKTVYTATVTFNGNTYTDTKEVSIPTLGHDYQLTGWVWSDDYTSATALFTCAHDVLHVQTLEAAVTSETTPATCEEAGKTVYTATVTFEGKEYTDSKEVSIPASGHDWSDPVWTWTDDYSSAAALFTCRNDETHTETLPAEISIDETASTITYTAIVRFNNQVYTDTKTAEKTIEEVTVDRIYGSNRYDTAIKAADYLKELLKADKFDTIVLTTGEGFADALAGSYLANHKDAPILLIREKEKDRIKVIDYINENLKDNGTVYVLGGTKAVPNEWLTDLKVEPDRLAGENRYETDTMILKEAGFNGGDILVCVGKSEILNDNGEKIDSAYADSLSASAVDLPIFLVDQKKDFNEAQLNFLNEYKGRLIFYVIGGEGAVPEEVVEKLREYGTYKDRLAGSNRYDTSVLIADTFFPDADKAVLAYGHDYPDGLAGGTIAFHLHSPLLLSRPREKDRDKTIAYTSSHNIHDGIVLGGTKLIDDGSVSLIFDTDISHIHVYGE